MVAVTPLMKAFERPALSITRRSSKLLSSLSKACSLNQFCNEASSSPVNSATISARAAPSRTTLASARPPNASVSASIKIDLPAPVSPVKTVKPDDKSSSTKSTITKSRIASARSISETNGKNVILIDRRSMDIRSSAASRAMYRNNSSPADVKRSRHRSSASVRPGRPRVA